MEIIKNLFAHPFEQMSKEARQARASHEQVQPALSVVAQMSDAEILEAEWLHPHISEGVLDMLQQRVHQG